MLGLNSACLYTEDSSAWSQHLLQLGDSDQHEQHYCSNRETCFLSHQSSTVRRRVQSAILLLPIRRIEYWHWIVLVVFVEEALNQMEIFKVKKNYTSCLYCSPWSSFIVLKVGVWVHDDYLFINQHFLIIFSSGKYGN